MIMTVLEYNKLIEEVIVDVLCMNSESLKY